MLSVAVETARVGRTMLNTGSGGVTVFGFLFLLGLRSSSSSSAVAVVGLSAASAVNEAGGGGGAGVVSFLFSGALLFISLLICEDGGGGGGSETCFVFHSTGRSSISLVSICWRRVRE